MGHAGVGFGCREHVWGAEGGCSGLVDGEWKWHSGVS